MIILLCIQLITPVFPYTTLFRSYGGAPCLPRGIHAPSRRQRARARKHTARPAGRGYSREWITSGGGAAVEQRRFDIARSEEHTSELQSPCNHVCRLLLEKKQLTY